jgi:hypothetical protein
MKKLTMNITKNTKKRIFAISDAPAAIPPNPRTAAIRAKTRKLKAQFNIIYFL